MAYLNKERKELALKFAELSELSDFGKLCLEDERELRNIERKALEDNRLGLMLFLIKRERDGLGFFAKEDSDLEDSSSISKLDLDFQVVEDDPKLKENCLDKSMTETTDYPELNMQSRPSGLDSDRIGEILITGRKEELKGTAGDYIIDIDVPNGKEKNKLKGGDDALLAKKLYTSLGGSGGDLLDASNGKGCNKLKGGGGNYILIANRQDNLAEGAGHDVMWAKGSGSSLSGGDGEDSFLFSIGTTTTVTDFPVGVDRLTIVDDSGTKVVRVDDTDILDAKTIQLQIDDSLNKDFKLSTEGLELDYDRFATLWGLNNTGQAGGSADADIGAPEAWDIGRGDRSVVVAVIDTRIDYNHIDLADQHVA